MQDTEIFIVTGLSGSGKSLTLNVLEDSGFFCIDNLPITLMDTTIDFLQKKKQIKIAISVDARDKKSIELLISKLDLFKSTYQNFNIIFLTANNTNLLQRYSETRRRHPLSFQTNIFTEDKMSLTITECINLERKLLEKVHEKSISIDTSRLKPSDLKQWILKLIRINPKSSLVIVQSFAFKDGIPLDTDLVFDARCLPNPYYDRSLRAFNGKDLQIVEFLSSKKIVNQYINEIYQYLSIWLPKYLNKERSYFTISIGCTGGKHRSVYCTEEISNLLEKKWTVSVRHKGLLKN